MDVERSVRSWMASEKDVEVEKLVEGMYLIDLVLSYIMICLQASRRAAPLSSILSRLSAST